jgi:hypothetical protein
MNKSETKYQLSGDLKNKEYESVLAFLRSHKIRADRVKGRIACFDSEDEANRVLSLLKDELPYIELGIYKFTP